jgi:phosphate starvation-inducible protein PhoH
MPKQLPEDCMFFGMASTLTDEQKHYVDCMYSDDYDIIFCNSPAGTGKTTLAVAVAKLLVSEKRYKKLIFTFSPVEENKMGFRPGTQFEKDMEYTIPLRQALIKINEQPEKAILTPDSDPKKIKEGAYWVEAMSHTFARGTNVEESVIIIDESQNWTLGQLKKMLTRAHDTSKVIVIGHTGQCDLPDKSQSGFQRYIKHYSGQERAAICSLTHNFRGWLAQHADLLEE